MNPVVLERTNHGLYCPAGDFYVDPWRPVERAIITHAHADHARWGNRHYLTTHEGLQVARVRLGAQANLQAIPYGEVISHQQARVSLHPAGHIIGSAQVRVEVNGEVWVASGDYKVEPDPTCTPFDVVPCHTFITESTFGLPIYRWPDRQQVVTDILRWWQTNRDAGKASLLLGYALGKSQRLLAGLDPSIGPIYTHGAVEKLTQAYRASGFGLPPTTPVGNLSRKQDWAGSIILAPPSVQGTPWTRRFGNLATGLASGWMTIRGTRRRKAVDRGFVLSDHADWPGLLNTIAATGAERVLVTHGYTAVLVRWLQERGIQAETVATQFEGERDDAGAETPLETEE